MKIAQLNFQLLILVLILALPSATPWVDSNANSNGTRDSNTSALMRTQFTTPFSQEDRLATTELTAHLAAHLLDLYQYLPQSWLPISSRGKVLSQFEAVGRRLDALPPQVEVT